MIKHPHNSPATTTTWLTPPKLIEDLGPFDLDPCAAVNQPWRTAERQYTTQDDGLAQEWTGSVWLNPPYGRDTKHWMSRMAEHNSGIALVFVRTDTRWWLESVWKKATGVYFLSGRLRFHHACGNVAAANAGAASALVAYGTEDYRLQRGNFRSSWPGASCGIFGVVA